MVNDITPLEGFEETTGLFLACLDDSTTEWRLELGEVDSQAVTWRAAPGSYTIGGLYLHLIAVEVGWFEVATGLRAWTSADATLLKVRETDVDEGIWPDPYAESIDWYHDLHKKFRTRCRESVRGLRDPSQAFEVPFGKVTWRWILNHMVEHDAYTGGQMVALNEIWKKKR